MNTRLERTKAKLINQRNAAITKLKVPIPLLKMPTLEDLSYFRIIKIICWSYIAPVPVSKICLEFSTVMKPPPPHVGNNILFS